MIGARPDRKAALAPRGDGPLSVKLVGLGGVGGVVARYGALYFAALGREVRLTFIDGDAFEPPNASRMIFATSGNKASVLRDELLPLTAGSRLTLFAVGEYVTTENAARWIRDGDVVLLCVDNHATRKTVSDHAVKLDEICLISGGNDGVGSDAAGRTTRGTYGNCQIHLRRGGHDLSPALTAFHPEIDEPADRAPGELGCAALTAAVPQILFANLMTGSAMLNALWLWLCDALHYPELCFDIAEGLMRPVPLPGTATETRVSGTPTD